MKAVEAFHASGQDPARGSCGYAFVYAYKPSYRFREALKKLCGAYGPQWIIDCTAPHPYQNISVHEVMAEAAAAVLRAAYPAESIHVSVVLD